MGKVIAPKIGPPLMYFFELRCLNVTVCLYQPQEDELQSYDSMLVGSWGCLQDDSSATKGESSLKEHLTTSQAQVDSPKTKWIEQQNKYLENI